MMTERAKVVALFQRSGRAARAEFAVNGNQLHQRGVIASTSRPKTQLTQLQEQAFDNNYKFAVIQQAKLGSNN